MAVRRIEGMLHLANEDRYAILVGRFNSFVVEHLLEGAVDTLKRHGVSEDISRSFMHLVLGNFQSLQKN